MGSNTPGAASSAADLVPSWRPKRLQNRGPNVKKSMLKSMSFFTSIFSSLGPRFGRVLGRFLVGFSRPKRMQPAIRRKSSDRHFVLEKPIRNACRHFCDRRRFEQKSMKKSMFFWTSILEAFWDDFGRVWVRFWEAETVDFRCFFDAFSKTNFRRRFGRQKIEKNRQQKR